MRRYHELRVEERAAIQLGRECGETIRSLARRLGRSPSTVSRELRRHAPGGVYLATAAQQTATVLRHKTRAPRKLLDRGRWDHVIRRLRAGWSPQQIAVRLRRERPDDRKAHVSHETIYKAIYLIPRGELRRELIACLRRGQAARRPRSRGRDRRHVFADMKSIHERPQEVEGRLVPGHWEGDLLKGLGNRCAVGMMVERMTNFVVLAQMPSASATDTLNGFDAAFQRVPEGLRKTLTYDQGREMSAHLALTARAGVAVYFADPHSPWQRASCENTNGLLRQYLPKGSDLSVHSQDDLNAVALKLNTRPRVRLDGRTPLECFSEIIARDQVQQTRGNDDRMQ
jgi:transposase, IS30 family